MKAMDYVINKEFKLEVMNLMDLRKRIMDDNYIKDIDIISNYISSDSWRKIMEFLDDLETGSLYQINDRYYYTNLDLKHLYFNWKRGFWNEEILKAVGVKKSEKKTMFDSGYEIIYEKTTIEEAYNNVCHDLLCEFNEIQHTPNRYFLQGLNSSYIVLNKNGDKLELLDGFYRCLYKNMNYNAVVKIYDNLTDSEWMEVLINQNAWKLDSSEKFFDRGFLMALLTRYGIKESDFISPCYSLNMIKILKLLTSQLYTDMFITYDEDVLKRIKDKKISKDIIYNRGLVLRNEWFISDLKAVSNILNYVPNNMSVIRDNKDKIAFILGYETFLERFLNQLFFARVLYSDCKQKEFSLDVYKKMLEDKKFRKTVNHLSNLISIGHVTNNYDKNINYFFNMILQYIVEK